jgi:tetratricopeptide (TPR) repeat protein
MACAVALALLLLITLKDRMWLAFLIAIVFLIPGRLQGFFYREFFRGRRLMDGNQSSEAIVHLESFLAKLRNAPWQRHLLWLQFSVYTPSVEAMTLNNIGAAQLNLGQLDEAEDTLQRALVIDPLYSLPHYNLAVMHSVRGHQDQAEHSVKEAARLGYVESKLDKVLTHAQSLLARIEGRGVVGA